MKNTETTPHPASQPARYKQMIAAPGRYLGIAASRLPDSYWAGGAITIGGLAAILLLCWAIDHWVVALVNPGWFFLPIVALVGYRWGWRLGLIATAGELLLVWYFFTPPRYWQGPPAGDGIARLLSLTIGTLFTLALVDLAARQQRDATRLAEANATLFRQEAERRAHLEALHQVGAALSSELDKERLLQLIAGTARDLTGAGFAAFTLRHDQGEDERFHLAGAAGLTPARSHLPHNAAGRRRRVSAHL